MNKRIPSTWETLEQRFWPKVAFIPFHTCWEWIAGKKDSGYGALNINGRMHGAHRLSLIIHGIKIPKNKVVDHICRNRGCVNPQHLRLVSIAQNATENNSSPAAINKKKTHCKYGHLLNEDNIYRHQKGKRDCKKCRLTNHKKYHILRIARRRIELE